MSSSRISVGVIGAGTMGRGIAQVAAAAGETVGLFDAVPGAAQKAISAIGADLERSVAKGRIEAAARDVQMARLIALDSLPSLASSVLVIEAIAEKLEAKQELFRKLESIVSRDAILATNTSSLSVTAIAAALSDPQRCVGMHFFNPPTRMALVEIITGLQTSPDMAQTAATYARAWGKTTIFARSSPGFIVNRVARPFYAEALRLCEEHATDTMTVDAVLRECGGFPMGPFELMDLIGNDINYAVTCSVFEGRYGDPRFLPSVIQRELVEAGRLGRKSGQGFYNYQSDTKPAPHAAPDAPPPDFVTIRGTLGPAEALTELIEKAGLAYGQEDLPSQLAPHLEINGVILGLCDGRLADEWTHDFSGKSCALFDYARNYRSAARVCVSFSQGKSKAAESAVCGFFQHLGKEVSIIEDSPGLIVTRSLAMLVNEAMATLEQKIASAEDIDLAMTLGTNYPQGPLAWGADIGLTHIMTVMENLYRLYGEPRYRPALMLRRRAYAVTCSKPIS